MQERSTRSIKTTTLIRRFLPYFKKYRGMLVFDLVCAALTTVCDLVLPLIVRNITDLAANDLTAGKASLFRWNATSASRGGRAGQLLHGLARPHHGHLH